MNLYIRGPIFSCSGYARIRHLVKELYYLGVNIELSPFNIFDRVQFDNYELLKNLQKNIKQIDISLHVGIPFQFQKKPNTYNIGYTMFETSSIPKLWVECCNEMDEIWVPTEQNKTTFELSGVKKPITVIPFGFDETIFYPKPKPHSKFVFLCVGTYIDRKGWDILFNAFQIFLNNKNVHLVCKFDKTNSFAEKEVCNLISKFDNITILSDNLDDCEMAKLYNSVDCFVLPTRGEGFCMTALESVACGKPVIITKDSGYGDYLNDSNAWFIHSKGLFPASNRLCSINPVYYNTWFNEPDVDHLKQLLLQAINKRKPNVSVDRSYSYQNIAKQVYNEILRIKGI
jgi:hypothetical protein